MNDKYLIIIRTDMDCYDDLGISDPYYIGRQICQKFNIDSDKFYSGTINNVNDLDLLINIADDMNINAETFNIRNKDCALLIGPSNKSKLESFTMTGKMLSNKTI
jgi:hypothetical protein